MSEETQVQPQNQSLSATSSKLKSKKAIVIKKAKTAKSEDCGLVKKTSKTFVINECPQGVK